MRARRGCAVIVAGVLVGVAGCSPGAAGAPHAAASASPPASPASPAPTDPHQALCDAVRTALNAIPKPTAGDNLPTSAGAYYNALADTLAANDGSDPAGRLMAAHARRLAGDYQALYTAQSQGDAGGWDRARSAVAADVRSMAGDEPAFDRACGVSGLVASPVAIGSLPQASAGPVAAPEQVTYACTGHGAVEITYGANGSQHSASRLPFHHTDPLTAGALYYVTTAQLQGSGSVSCQTTVQTDNLDGSADDVTNSGSADGSFNIASAQVCQGADGWEKC